MTRFLLQCLVVFCLVLAGCLQDSDLEEDAIPDSDYPGWFGQNPDPEYGENESDEGEEYTDDGDDSEEGDTKEDGDSAEQPDSDGDGVPDEDDQCPGEDDTVDDDASGEPDCTENQT